MSEELFVSLEAMLDDIAKETVKILDATSGKLPPSKKRQVIAKFISSVTELVILDALKQKPSGKATKEEHYAFTSKNFLSIKGELQNMVAEGFNKALKKFSGKDPDYYCQVKPFPTPINKQAC